jgi:hypothetical protein
LPIRSRRNSGAGEITVKDGGDARLDRMMAMAIFTASRLKPVGRRTAE